MEELLPNNIKSITSIILLLQSAIIQPQAGGERTGQEFLALVIGAGFIGITFLHRVSDFWIMYILMHEAA